MAKKSSASWSAGRRFGFGKMRNPLEYGLRLINKGQIQKLTKAEINELESGKAKQRGSERDVIVCALIAKLAQSIIAP